MKLPSENIKRIFLNTLISQIIISRVPFYPNDITVKTPLKVRMSQIFLDKRRNIILFEHEFIVRGVLITLFRVKVGTDKCLFSASLLSGSY